MKTEHALIQLTAALQKSSGATTWTEAASDWLSGWVGDRAAKLADERGAPAIADLCETIRSKPFAIRANGELDSGHLADLEASLQSGTFLCDPDEPGG